MGRTEPIPRAVLQATSDDAGLEGPLYAVNLLDRRRPWAYDLYNVLAAPVALRVGARPMMKGVDGECWFGEASLGRETLLVVGYDEADAFLRMVRNPYFAWISMLRKVSFAGFEFGFCRRLDDGMLPPKRPRRRKGELLALLWPEGQHDSEVPGPNLTALQRRVSAAGSRIVFYGEKKAILALDRGSEKGISPTRLAPPLPWSSVVVVAGHRHTLRPLSTEPLPGMSLAIHYRQVF
ncbi:MAG: hypothetical protein MPN21_26165 [Thermoanaerobaculia bacterium]|nr:hypothetical protein [Thermoanaerobaculia bacterium]